PPRPTLFPYTRLFRSTAKVSVEPEDEYARSKREAEQALHRELDAARFTIVRTPLVYGPGVRANFLSLLKKAGWPLPLGAVRNARDRKSTRLNSSHVAI